VRCGRSDVEVWRYGGMALWRSAGVEMPRYRGMERWEVLYRHADVETQKDWRRAAGVATGRSRGSI